MIYKVWKEGRKNIQRTIVTPIKRGKRKKKVGKIVKLLDASNKDIEAETIVLDATDTINDLPSLLPAPSFSYL